MRNVLLLLFLFWFSGVFAQESSSLVRSVTVATQDTIVLEQVSISPFLFKITDPNQQIIDSTFYRVNFEKGYVILLPKLQEKHDTISIEYQQYPAFLTKTYSLLDRNLIVPTTDEMDRLLSLQSPVRTSNFKPFDGLNTTGSISRGITVGNNQNAVLNSQLDLQITGKINDRVSIRASIQDANLPMQEGGYSQNINEFDQIFIELFSDHWAIRAGDIDLTNQNSAFARFNKKIQGLSVSGTLPSDTSETSMFMAGGVVRGIFARSEFIGQEGNQGPYKLIGPNGELFVLIISGSERVFVNGVPLQRGEDRDYIIDYNAGEIRFNATYPITSEMRIVVEYQYSDRNYTRLIGYGGGNYSSNNLQIGVFGYIESDLKNQPLQQNLTAEQVAVLQQAGNDPSLMVAPSAVESSFSENKILYKKEVINGEEIFVFSNNPEEELFQVRFTLVGNNQGNYVVSSNTAISRIFEYVPPINGVPQGNYEPVVRLFAPTQLQVGGINGSYAPSNKTKINFELAASNKNKNLFSDLDNEANKGFAARTQINHLVLKSGQQELRSYFNLDYIDENYQTIERLYDVEFNRDWALPIEPLGNQRLIQTGLKWNHSQVARAFYEFQQLQFSENFSGSRHLFGGSFNNKRLSSQLSASFLSNEGAVQESSFTRLRASSLYSIGSKYWAGAKVETEDQQTRYIESDSLTALSQRFALYEVFAGVGDSTAVFAQLGYRHRVNDSLRNNELTRVSQSNTFYIKSQLIQNQHTQLSIFANYRVLKDQYSNRPNENSLNSRLLYNQRLFNGGIHLNTAFESNSGVLPQQEFTFLEVEAGQGTHVWIDYNNNGIQELDEFELAQFPDEGRFIRVLLPNQVFVKIHQNKWSQTLTLQPGLLFSNNNSQSVLSRFYNQTSYTIDRKTLRSGSGFDLSPFSSNINNQVGLLQNFRNVLFYNRGLQRYTTSYTFLQTKTKNLLSVGLQENHLKSHQVNFSHLFSKQWLINLSSQIGFNESISESFEQRNFTIESFEFLPKLSYLLSSNTQFSLVYSYAIKENIWSQQERLEQHKMGIQFLLNEAGKFNINGDFDFISNRFQGNAFLPVSYQMLEGLQPNNNLTWRLNVQRNITNFLDLNVTYLGRKSENSNTIHTGSVQIRAFF